MPSSARSASPPAGVAKRARVDAVVHDALAARRHDAQGRALVALGGPRRDDAVVTPCQQAARCPGSGPRGRPARPPGPRHPRRRRHRCGACGCARRRWPAAAAARPGPPPCCCGCGPRRSRDPAPGRRGGWRARRRGRARSGAPWAARGRARRRRPCRPCPPACAGRAARRRPPSRPRRAPAARARGRAGGDACRRWCIP
jgi:hypothetical protein